MWVMSATTGMMFGAQYFQAEDKPLYVQPISLISVLVQVLTETKLPNWSPNNDHHGICGNFLRKYSTLDLHCA